MCKSAAEGGQRCPGKGRRSLASAEIALAKASGDPRRAAVAEARWRAAAAEYASCPEGRTVLYQRLREAEQAGDLHQEVALASAIRRGEQIRAANLDTAARVRQATGQAQPARVRLCDCYWIDPDSMEASKMLLDVHGVDPDSATFTRAPVPLADLADEDTIQAADQTGPEARRLAYLRQAYLDEPQNVPPLLVIRHPAGSAPRYSVVDGLHRLGGAWQARRDSVDCLLVDA